MSNSTKSCAMLPVALKRAKRFTLLWCALFAVVILMAAGEGFVLWLGGYRYEAPTSLTHACIRDFSIEEKGNWAAARVSFGQYSKKEGYWDDIVLIDLRRLDAVRLGIRELQPRRVALSPDGDSLAIACADGTIYEWSRTPDRLHQNSAPRASLRWFGRSSEPEIWRLVFSPDGRRLAVIGVSYTCLWQWPDGKLLYEQRHENGSSTALCFSADSRSVVSPGEPGQKLLWDTNTGQSIRAVPAARPRVVHASLSLDSQLFAMLRCHYPHLFSVHSLESGQKLWSGRSSAPAVALSAGGRLLAVCQGWAPCHIRIYDAKGGQRLGELPGHEHQIVGLAFSSAGLLYSWDVEGLIRVWDVIRQRELRSFSIFEWASGE